MAVSPLDKPPYTPLFPPPVQSVDLQQVENWVKQELDTIARYTTAQPGTLFTPGNAIPARPRTGILTYADGTNWNPGYGEGLYIYKGGVWVPVGVGAGNRIRLSTATTFYVATNGNDANNGLTPATAWLTLAHAISVLTGQYDFGGQTVTLQAVAGHAAFSSSQLRVSPWVGGGAFIYDGAGGSIAYVGALSLDGTILIADGALPGPFTIQNVTLSNVKGTGQSVDNLAVYVPAKVIIGPGVVLSTSSRNHMLANQGGANIQINNSFSVTGNAPGSVFNAGTGGSFFGIIPVTCTTGTITVGGFAGASFGGSLIFIPAISYNDPFPSVHVTGNQWATSTGGGLVRNPSSQLPGSTAGGPAQPPGWVQ